MNDLQEKKLTLEDLLIMLSDMFEEELGDTVPYRIWLKGEKAPFIKVSKDNYYERYLEVEESELLRLTVRNYRIDMKRGKTYINIVVVKNKTTNNNYIELPFGKVINYEK